MDTKELLINDIKDFIGRDGVVSFEHGYRPLVNCTSITHEGVTLRVSKNGKPFQPFAAMDVSQLKDIVCELVRYFNFCNKL